MLTGRKIAVWDLEIKNNIDGKIVTWNDHHKMGVSVLCMYDYFTDRYRVFDDSTMGEAIDILTTYDYIAGFNTINFDWRVLTGTYPDLLATRPRVANDYDVFKELLDSMGQARSPGGCKLDDIAGATLGVHKSGSGAFAPELFQNGRIAELYDYVIQDVKVEKELFEFVVKYGYVVRGQMIHRLRKPFHLSNDERISNASKGVSVLQ